MVTVPDRLLTINGVTCLCNTPQITVLKKKLTSSSFERKCYLNRYAITLILQGQQWIQIDNQDSISVSAGQVSVLRTGLYTITDIVPDNGQFSSLHFFVDPQTFAGILTDIPKQSQNKAADAVVFYPSNLLAVFTKSVISYEHIKSELPPSLLMKKYLELMELLDLEFPEHYAQLGNLVVKHKIALRQFMKKHALKPLTIQDYARISGKSESSFRREFKSKFGTTPKAWLMQTRMKKAEELVRKNMVPVHEMAEKCGFDNVSHFITTYKKYFGVTPGEKRFAQ